MIIFVIALLLISLYKCKPILNGKFYEDYCSIEQTKSINGIFIMLILLSHTFVRVSSSGGIFDDVYMPLRTFLGQFVVVPFLFYSGYGIMESISKKESYIKSFPKQRFLKLFTQFAIITVIYIVFNLLIGRNYSITQILLSFIGLTSIGNGGWYMFSIFVFYVAVTIWFNVFKKNKIMAASMVAVCLVVLTVVEMFLDFPTYYYNTTIFLAVGMFFSLLKDTFNKIVMKNNIIWFLVLMVSLAGFILCKGLINKTVVFYPIWCGLGLLMVLCITMKIRIQNKVLSWCGQNVFYIFTLQGIPQIFFTRFLSNNYLIYSLVIITTILLSALAGCLFNKVDNYILRRREKDYV